MTFFPSRTAAASLLLLTLSCGGKPEPGPATNAAPVPSAATSGAGVEVTGTLAPSVAPPAALVVLAPQSGIEVPVKAEPAIMDQAGYEFLPGFLLAQTRQAVVFRNSEDVLHNVRVTESSQQKPIFNVATVAFGSYEHKFEEPGLYNVGCDIHPTMRASILVTATPYTANSGADGSFTMTNVKPGRYNLTVYAGAAPVVRAVEVKSGRTDLGVIQ
jgi:plastocyanin